MTHTARTFGTFGTFSRHLNGRPKSGSPLTGSLSSDEQLDDTQGYTDIPTSTWQKCLDFLNRLELPSTTDQLSPNGPIGSSLQHSVAQYCVELRQKQNE